MAHKLEIALGASTFSLSGSSTSSSQTLMNYVPRSPNLSVIQSNSIIRDGGRRAVTTRRNVTETATFRISASSANEMRSTIQDLERAFLRAEMRQQIRSGSRVYVNWTPSDISPEEYRSEVLSGKIIPKEDTLNWRWGRYDIEVDAVWSRMYYWEETAERNIPLTNGNGTGTVAVLTVYNHDDAGAGHDNWVNIAGSDIKGVLPTPAIIKMENNDADDTLARVWIGHNVFSGGSAFNHVIEAEDATSGGSSVTDATNSGGAYRTRDWTGTGEIQLMVWTLAASDLNLAAGRWFHAIARFHNNSNLTDTTFKFIIHGSGGTGTVWEGPEVKPPTSPANIIQDLGLVKLPPWGGDIVSSGDMAISLRGRSDTSGNSTINLDYIHFLPVDSWRTLYVVVGSVDNTDRLVDDGVSEITYYDDNSGTTRYAPIAVSGDFIKLWPGIDQRVYFITHTGTGNDAPIDFNLGVTMSYRRRYLTI